MKLSVLVKDPRPCGHPFVSEALPLLDQATKESRVMPSARLNDITVEPDGAGLSFSVGYLTAELPPVLEGIPVYRVAIEDTGDCHFPSEGYYRYGTTYATVEYYTPQCRDARPHWKITVRARRQKSAVKVYNMIRGGKLLPNMPWIDVSPK